MNFIDILIIFFRAFLVKNDTAYSFYKSEGHYFKEDMKDFKSYRVIGLTYIKRYRECEKLYRSPICDALYSTIGDCLDDLEFHLSHYTCSHCDFSNITSVGCWNHIYTSHNGEATVLNTYSFKCFQAFLDLILEVDKKTKSIQFISSLVNFPHYTKNTKKRLTHRIPLLPFKK